MNKLSKLTALLLALLMVIAAPMAAVAETITTEKQYEEQVSVILAQLYDTLMQTTTYEEVLEATKGMTRTEIVNFLDRLLADKVVTDNFVAYDEYLWQLYEEYIDRETYVIPVTYTNAAPLMDFSTNIAEEASVFSVQERGDTTTTDSGISLTKTATMNANGTSGTIRLEAFSTGSYSETTTSSAIDVILVLDLSKSMTEDGGGGESGYIPVFEYNPVTDITTLDQSKTYYALIDNMYLPVSYCTSCKAWTYGCYHYSYNPNNDSVDDGNITGTVIDPTKEDVVFNTRDTVYVNGEADEEVKRSALMTAVKSFTNQLIAESTTADNRIAFVRFNGSAINVNNNATVTAANAFMTLNTTAGQNAALNTVGTGTYANDVSKVLWTADSGTRPDYGTSNALEILKAAYGETPTAASLAARKRVVIVFTDGKPSGGSGGHGSSTSSTDIAGNAISYANTIKNTYQSTVYSVGVVEGADGRVPFTKYSTSFDINQFLHFLSSNFQSATGYTPWTVPTYPELGSYYLSADDSTTLSNIFDAIASEIKKDLDASSSLGASASTTVDVLSDYFQLPDSVTSSDLSKIKVYTADCNGGAYSKDATTGDIIVDKTKLTFGTETPFVAAKVTLTGKQTGNDTISVTNFSFADNWCGPTISNGTVTDWVGKKLIIEIPFEVRPGFLGGNGVPTNTDAGVYSVDATTGEKVLVQGVTSPVVNIPIKGLTVTAEDKHIYLSNSLTQEDMISGAIVRDAYGAEIKLNPYDETGKYGLAEWQLEYVTVEIDTTLDGQPFLVDTEDAFTIKCTVTPIDKGITGTSGDKAEKTASTGTADVYVYTPEVTFQDSVEKYYTEVEVANDTDFTYYNSNNIPDNNHIVWTHTYTDGVKVTVTDSATRPTVSTATEGATVTITQAKDSEGNVIVNTWTYTLKDADDNESTRTFSMSGTDPELKFAYDADSWQTTTDDNKYVINATKDVPVTVTTTAMGNGYTNGLELQPNQIKYIRNKYLTTDDDTDKDCSDVTCDAQNDYVANTAKAPAFVIHVYDVSSTLTVQKSGMENGESAIVNVAITKDGTTKTYTVVFNEDVTSVTFANVLIGSTYEVTEQTGWSWRYTLGTPVYVNTAKTIVADTSQNVVTIQNDRTNDKWMSDESAVENNLGDGTSDPLNNVFNDE